MYTGYKGVSPHVKGAFTNIFTNLKLLFRIIFTLFKYDIADLSQGISESRHHKNVTK